ncbi:MAG: hypothetical protein FWF98_05515, partial [Dehalococcoidia bacterium]|nr:hypothetical protein [Dehalococcoidia bacterium]
MVNKLMRSGHFRSISKRFIGFVLVTLMLVSQIIQAFPVMADPPGELGQDSGSSISGFLWVDGNGSLPTDWDGLYNGAESPLPGYAVFLYAANNLQTPLSQTTTSAGGAYTFGGLEHGSYVVGLKSATVDGKEYLLPLAVTAESKFAIDWGTNPLMAFTDPITITANSTIENINAGMRLPMGVAPTATYTIDLSTVANGGYLGYTVYNEQIVFDTPANGNIYVISQSNNSSPSRFNDITIRNNVNTTLVLSGITFRGNVSVGTSTSANAKLTLLLSGNNTINGSIYVTSSNALVIDSNATTGSNSGTLTVTAVSPGSDAAIGGSSFSRDAGSITIRGGTVTATGSTYGAGIGGGNNGNGGNSTVEIHGGTVSASSIYGAGIGGGGCGGASFDATGGIGNIIISGGNVSATSEYGAGIGGGGGGVTAGALDIYRKDGGSGGNITISGGSVTSTSTYGAGIGGGGSQYHRAGNGGTIAITGGNVIATSTKGAGIGGGSYASSNVPGAFSNGAGAVITFNATADIKAYSEGNLPAIHASNNNAGNGYYVNAMLDN